jgi:signal recognition particle subunit SRP14
VKVLDDPLADLNPPHPLPVLIRATDGKSKEHRKEKIKLSTVVDPDALEGFYARYAEVCKAGMQALKKRDRSGRKKAKAKKRKGGGEGSRRREVRKNVFVGEVASCFVARNTPQVWTLSM